MFGQHIQWRTCQSSDERVSKESGFSIVALYAAAWLGGTGGTRDPSWKTSDLEFLPKSRGFTRTVLYLLTCANPNELKELRVVSRWQRQQLRPGKKKRPHAGTARFTARTPNKKHKYKISHRTRTRKKSTLPKVPCTEREQRNTKRKKKKQQRGRLTTAIGHSDKQLRNSL